jgi:TonB family protein
MGVSLNGMIFISLLFHILILSLLVIPRSLPTPKWTFGPIYSVQLVSLPADFSEKKEASLSYKEIMENKTSGLAVLKKESIDTLSSTPITTVRIRQKPANSIEHVLESIRRNIQPAASPSVPSAVSKGTEHIASQSSPSQVRPGNGELNAKMSIYYRMIWTRIKGMWSLPQGILPRGNIEAVIHAQILRDGTIVDVSFERRSGNRFFDESAMRAVKKAGPLPPLPEGVGDSSIEVGIRFHPSEFR